jgi:hypothetical protein
MRSILDRKPCHAARHLAPQQTEVTHGTDGSFAPFERPCRMSALTPITEVRGFLLDRRSVPGGSRPWGYVFQRGATNLVATMSAQGQKLPKSPCPFRSALPPIADMIARPLHDVEGHFQTHARQYGRNSLGRSSIALIYSITSSARPRSGSGTAMPSAFAVLRLMTNSNLVTSCTGKSAAFSPLRIRPT